MSIPADLEIKRQVRQFYNQVGWQRVGDCCYQNARYEDLRPVSREYIHLCHMRVLRHLVPYGRYLLDAGSGPIQYPEYLEYSKGYKYRVCADISYVALQEARARIGDQGLYVVADVADLPFKEEAFEGVMALHTIQHLPQSEFLQGYKELHRVLAPTRIAVVVNRWQSSILMRVFYPFMFLAKHLLHVYRKITGRHTFRKVEIPPERRNDAVPPTRTFIHRHNTAWLEGEVGALMLIEILVWRSVSTRFLRTLIHRRIGGRWFLRVIFWLEERAPHFFGTYGQYPLVVIRKP